MSQQNLTESDTVLAEGLSPVQQQAVICLAFGLSVTATADFVRRSRGQVSEWYNNDETFMNAINGLRQRFAYDQVEQFARLRRKALEAVETALDGDGPERLTAAKLLLSLPQPKVSEVEKRAMMSKSEAEQALIVAGGEANTAQSVTPQEIGKANLPFDVAVALARQLVAILTARFPERTREDILTSASRESGVPVALLAASDEALNDEARGNETPLK
jgi:hypothetical protein